MTMETRNILDTLPTISTRLGHIVPPQAVPFYSYVKENLRENPFINNQVHRSVEINN